MSTKRPKDFEIEDSQEIAELYFADRNLYPIFANES